MDQAKMREEEWSETLVKTKKLLTIKNIQKKLKIVKIPN